MIIPLFSHSPKMHASKIHTMMSMLQSSRYLFVLHKTSLLFPFIPHQ